MPNDCSNSFTITNVTNDQWRELAASFQRGGDEEQGFLATFNRIHIMRSSEMSAII